MTGMSTDSFAFFKTMGNFSVDLTLYPIAPKLSASLTKSGLLNLVNAFFPNSSICFSEIIPRSESHHTTIIIGNFNRTAVSISCTFIKNPASPHIATTFRFILAS